MNIPFDVLDMACYPLRKHIPELTPERLQKALEMTEETLKAEVKPGAMLTIKEVANRLQISKVTCWRMIKAKTLKTVRIGQRCTRVPESEVVRLGAGE